MLHILKNQKPLEKIKIFANRKILTLYFVLLCGLCIAWTVYTIILSLDFAPNNFNQVIKLMTITLKWAFYNAVDCLILYTLVCLSNKVEEEHVDEITRSLK